MKYVPPKFTKLSDMAAIDVGRLTEDEARTILEAIRWPDGPVCPHCGGTTVTRIQAKSKKVRDGVIQCNGCRGQFTVTVGTVMRAFPHYAAPVGPSLPFDVFPQEGRVRPPASTESWAFTPTRRRGFLPTVSALP